MGVSPMLAIIGQEGLSDLGLPDLASVSALEHRQHGRDARATGQPVGAVGQACVSARSAAKQTGSAAMINLGFVPLIDAAPLIAALELGYFAQEGLHVSLCRQIGWGNVRDKLTFGQLHASHALLGMAPLSIMGAQQFAEPLVAIASLGAGGNAITFGRKLTSIGVTSVAALARLIERRQGKPLVFAHVFGCSTHHYLLRDWLSNAGIDPDEEVELCVLPPAQMVQQLSEGLLDGFCVGEPWGTLAVMRQQAMTVAATTQIVPDHPEKALAVSRRWLDGHRTHAERLVRATLRGCAYCHEPSHAESLAAMLADPKYLDLPRDVLTRALADAPPGSRSWAPATTFPRAEHAAWLLDRMRTWGHLVEEANLISIAQASTDPGPHHAAAAGLGWLGSGFEQTSQTRNDIPVSERTPSGFST